MSAPYGEGRPGTVFIYSGQNGSPIPVLSQTIVGSALNLEGELLEGLTSFGAFIEGNTDIDGNCHNGKCLSCTVTVMPWKHILILSVDLVIGAFQSRKIFVLRYVRLSVRPSVFVGAWSGVCGLVVHVVVVCYRIPSTILCTKKLSFEVIGATVKNSLGLFL